MSTYKNETLINESKKHSTQIRITRAIQTLKKELERTDYHAIKYAEGLIAESEYKPMKDYRQSLRDDINKLEEELKQAV